MRGKVHSTGMQKRTEDLLYGGWGGAVVAVGAALIILQFVMLLGGIRLGLFQVLAALSGSGLMGFVIQRAVIAGASKTAEAVVNPSGKTTPYVPTFSHIETLEVRGLIDAAEVAWLEEVALAPEHPVVVMRVAEFYLRTKRDRATALRYYERLIALPAVGVELTGYARRKLEELRSSDDRG
jgi:hypothetical protein